MYHKFLRFSNISVKIAKMPKASRRVKLIIIFIVVIAAGYGFSLFMASKSGVPQDFTAARMQGAIIAENIVTLSNQSTADLQKVNDFDHKGDYADALALTKNLIDQSKDLRDKAVELSAQVEAMTKSLSSVPVSAQQAALQSISSRLALITQLVNYSNDLTHLLDILQTKFEGGATTKGEVQALVNQINTDVNAINNFNLQAGQAMQEFDKIVKG